MAAHLEIIVTGVIVGSTIEIEEAKDREEMVRKVSEFVRNIKSVL
jgi:tryptophan synthase alpha subunit